MGAIKPTGSVGPSYIKDGGQAPEKVTPVQKDPPPPPPPPAVIVDISSDNP